MKFDKSKIYTAVNADELDKDDVVFVADTVVDLKNEVVNKANTCCIRDVESPSKLYRFCIDDDNNLYYALAYLIAKHDDPYKEFKKAQAEGKEVWYKDMNGRWNRAMDCRFIYSVDRYSLIEPTKQYKVFLYNGRFVFTYTEVPGNTHVYYTSTDEREASNWCTAHNIFADVAKAWEDGKQVQVKQVNGSWEYIEQPQWNTTHEYRVKPASIKWTDLKIGDVLQQGSFSAMVTSIERKPSVRHHIAMNGAWYSDEELTYWEKVNA